MQFFDGNRLLLLDGGLGTTIEDDFGKNLAGTSLWSSVLIDNDPETIMGVHKAFLDAGSDLILTSTYQCAFETFSRSGFSEKEARLLMRKSVNLAARAKQEFLERNTGSTTLPQITPQANNGKILVALSLGPYGATLSPAQEFDGFYPPPYGPQAYVAGHKGRLTNSFNSTTELALEESSIKALASFHLSRLMVFIENSDKSDMRNEEEDIWSHIDCIAFETVPLRREIIAIRRAMANFSDHLSRIGLLPKPWWISTVWPGGRFPEECKRDEIVADSSHLPPRDVAMALLGEISFSNKLLPKPDGIGINCTHVSDLNSVLSGLRIAVDELHDTKKPFLVLYPNGGAKYDPVNQCWLASDETPYPNPEERDSEAQSWAEFLSSTVRLEQDSAAWPGILVGGCCKTGPMHISSLKTALSRKNCFATSA